MDPINFLNKYLETGVLDLAKEFGEDFGVDIQPKDEVAPFAIHDAGHRQANIPATLYGELLQNVHDKATFGKLYGEGLIHGAPLEYGERAREGFSGSFVNYGRMLDLEAFNKDKEFKITQGTDPVLFEPGKELAYDTRLNRGITAQQKQLTDMLNRAKETFGKGESDVFEEAGNYDPKQGFMPNPSFRNVRNVESDDVNTAKIRGENFADALVKGYKKAVEEKRYIPQYELINNTINAKDLAEAAMKNQLKVDRGFSDEGLFPFKDKIAALSNPPARITTKQEALDPFFDIASEARSARNVSRLANTVRSGFNSARDIASSVPLFDPDFRKATEQGDARKAAAIIAKEYVLGSAIAPVVGVGVGALSQVAPKAASAVMTGLNLSRTANPIAVVSQLGGSSKITPRQEAYEQQLRNTKIQQAEAARQRGGKWKFPTPFGQMTIPELGISESKGLFFR